MKEIKKKQQSGPTKGRQTLGLQRSSEINGLSRIIDQQEIIYSFCILDLMYVRTMSVSGNLHGNVQRV